MWVCGVLYTRIFPEETLNIVSYYWDVKENVFRVMILESTSIGLLPLILIEMKPCYKGLKENGVDVDERWRKILGFRAS